ncbi:hypothetical protein HDU76_005883, partial [Blyttiomyces sp. JEL0837]
MKILLGPLILVAVAATLGNASNTTTPTTLPIAIPHNQYFVASSLISAVEYLHRAFPDHPAVYTQEGNFVYNYIDPVSGNLTDLVDVGDLYLNAQSLNDVLVGIEDVMFNELPNPDTAPIPTDAIADLKIAFNYITNIASFDYSKSDQAYIASFYNFTITRYKNLFARENTTLLLPLKPLNLTNSTLAITGQTPLHYNISIFDDIDGHTFNNTLSQNGTEVEFRVAQLLTNYFNALGIPTTFLNATTNATTPSASSITPTPVSTTVYTTPEPSVTDTNDPGGFGRRNHHLIPGSATEQIDISVNEASGSGSTGRSPTSVTQALSNVRVANELTHTLSNLLQMGNSPVSVRALVGGMAVHTQQLARAVSDVDILLREPVGDGLRGISAEAAKGNGIGSVGRGGLATVSGSSASRIANYFGDSGTTVQAVQQVSNTAEEGVMVNALTSFYGVSTNDANEAISASKENPSYQTSTTFSKIRQCVAHIAGNDATRQAYPDLHQNSPENVIGARMDSIIASKYP